MSDDDRSKTGPPPEPWQRELVVDARSGKRDDGTRRDAAGGRPTGRPAVGGPQIPGPADDWDAASFDELAPPPPAARRREAHPVFLAAPWAGVAALAGALFATATQILPSTLDLSTATFVIAIAALVLGGYALAGALMGRGRTDIAAAAVFLAAVSVLVGIWFDRPTPILTPT